MAWLPRGFIDEAEKVLAVLADAEVDDADAEVGLVARSAGTGDVGRVRADGDRRRGRRGTGGAGTEGSSLLERWPRWRCSGLRTTSWWWCGTTPGWAGALRGWRGGSTAVAELACAGERMGWKRAAAAAWKSERGAGSCGIYSGEDRVRQGARTVDGDPWLPCLGGHAARIDRASARRRGAVRACLAAAALVRARQGRALGLQVGIVGVLGCWAEGAGRTGEPLGPRRGERRSWAGAAAGGPRERGRPRRGCEAELGLLAWACAWRGNSAGPCCCCAWAGREGARAGPRARAGLV
jgi:hypothetical protein